MNTYWVVPDSDKDVILFAFIVSMVIFVYLYVKNISKDET